MKTPLTFLFIVLWFCSSNAREQVKYQPEDKEIFAKVILHLKDMKNKNMADLMVETGKFFLETPYVGHTLEFEPEQLVINLSELDCTTFAENCLAISRCIKSGKPSFERFCKELTGIRYRNEKIAGYPSRLHYFSDWIFENQEKGFIKDVTKVAGGERYRLEVNFMSTHPDSYKQLKNTPEFVSSIAQKENEICQREMYFIPNNKIELHEKNLEAGDIIGLTTSTNGLDITHVGILVKVNGRIHLMHASLSAEKVLITKEPLSDYLKDSKRITGIMMARPTN